MLPGCDNVAETLAGAMLDGEEFMDDTDELEVDTVESEFAAEVAGEEAKDADKSDTVTGSAGVVVAVVASAFWSPRCADATPDPEPEPETVPVPVEVPIIKSLGLRPRRGGGVGDSETEMVGEEASTTHFAEKGAIGFLHNNWRHWIRIWSHLIYLATIASSLCSAVSCGLRDSVGGCFPDVGGVPCILALILSLILI